MILAALALAQSQPPPPSISATPRDLHTGCHLTLRETDVPQRDGRNEPFSAAICRLAIIGAILHREGRSATDRNDLRFCLPHSADADSNPSRAMAAAYVDWYESNPARANSMPDGRTALVVAMIERWPCQPR